MTKKKRSGGGGLTGGDSDQGYFDPAGDYSRWSGHPTLRTLNILAWDPMNYFYDEGLSVDEYATAAEHTGSTGKYRQVVWCTYLVSTPTRIPIRASKSEFEATACKIDGAV